MASPLPQTLEQLDLAGVVEIMGCNPQQEIREDFLAPLRGVIEFRVGNRLHSRSQLSMELLQEPEILLPGRHAAAWALTPRSAPLRLGPCQAL